jgi:hypothetical protein
MAPPVPVHVVPVPLGTIFRLLDETPHDLNTHLRYPGEEILKVPHGCPTCELHHLTEAVTERGEHLPAIRVEGDLSLYTSGVTELDPAYQRLHEVEEMLFWHSYGTRVIWAIRTTKGRVIVVHQERSDSFSGRAAGEVEIANSPGPTSAASYLDGLRIDLESLLSTLRG